MHLCSNELVSSPRSIDQNCQSDLRVQAKAYEEIEPNSSGRPKGKPISQLSVGQVTKFYLHVELKNKKEPAYETNLYITVPSVLYYVQVRCKMPSLRTNYGVCNGCLKFFFSQKKNIFLWQNLELSGFFVMNQFESLEAFFQNAFWVFNLAVFYKYASTLTYK